MPSVTKNPGQTFTMPAGTDGVLIIDATGKAADGTGGRGGGGGSFERVTLNGVAQGTVFTVAYGGMGGVAVEVTNGVLGTVVLASGSQGQAGASTTSNVGDFGYPGGAGGGNGSSSGAGGGAGSLAGPGSDGDAANGGDVGGGDVLNNVGQNGTRGGGGSGPDGDGAGFGGDALFTYSDAGRTITVTAIDGVAGVAGASVTLGSDTQTTSAGGVAVFTNVSDASHSLSITKAGYSFTPTTITTDAAHTTFSETLARRIPVVETIRLNMAAAAATVTTGNGYNVTLNVQDVARYGNTVANGDTTLEQGDEETLGEDDEQGANQYHTFHQSFLFFINVRNPGNAAAYDSLLNTYTADLRKAVMADIQRGGYANWTHLQPSRLFENDAGQIAGVVVSFLVHYRTKLDDPYTPHS